MGMWDLTGRTNGDLLMLDGNFPEEDMALRRGWENDLFYLIHIDKKAVTAT
jgi:hypothetical protein